MTKEQLKKLFRDLDGLTVQVEIYTPVTRDSFVANGQVEVELTRLGSVEEIVIGGAAIFFNNRFDGIVTKVTIEANKERM